MGEEVQMRLSGGALDTPDTIAYTSRQSRFLRTARHGPSPFSKRAAHGVSEAS